MSLKGFKKPDGSVVKLYTDKTLTESNAPADAASVKGRDDALSQRIDVEKNTLAQQIANEHTYASDIDDRVTVLETGAESIISDVTRGWLDDHVTPVGSAIVVDDSLAVSGAAADSKTVGDELETRVSFDDIFGGGTSGAVPQVPEHYVQQGGQYSTFGYALSLEQDWEKAEYNAPNVTIQSKQGTSVLVNGYPPNWKACFSDLTHIKYTVSSYFMHSLAFGTDGNFLYGLYFNGKIQKAYSRSWVELSGNYPNIASGKEVELWVTPTALTCKVDGVTTSYDISSLNLTYVSFGFIALVSDTNKRSITFENMEVGDGHYEYDNTKFLRSDATWQTAPVSPEGFPSVFKDALLECFQQVAWATEHGRQYYDTLRLLLYPAQQADGWTDGEAYDDITVINGYKIGSTDGTSYAAEGWSKTDFVPCKGASSITFPALDESVHEYNHGAFYNQARWKVATITLSGTGERTVEVPSDAVFFAISSETEALEDLIETGIVPHA